MNVFYRYLVLENPRISKQRNKVKYKRLMEEQRIK